MGKYLIINMGCPVLREARSNKTRIVIVKIIIVTIAEQISTCILASGRSILAASLSLANTSG